MNDDEYRTYKLVKEAVKRREQEKKDADNAQRSSDGLPPRKILAQCRLGFNEADYV